MHTLQTLQVGQSDKFSKTISEGDIYTFAGITGDLNPVHVDEVHAAGTRFGKRIAHGMLTSAFICTVLGTKLPGVGTIHVSQTLEFKRPVFIGDTITVILQIIGINIDKRLVTISCIINNQHGESVVTGTSIVKPPISL